MSNSQTVFSPNPTHYPSLQQQQAITKNTLAQQSKKTATLIEDPDHFLFSNPIPHPKGIPASVFLSVIHISNGSLTPSLRPNLLHPILAFCQHPIAVGNSCKPTGQACQNERQSACRLSLLPQVEYTSCIARSAAEDPWQPSLPYGPITCRSHRSSSSNLSPPTYCFVLEPNLSRPPLLIQELLFPRLKLYAHFSYCF